MAIVTVAEAAIFRTDVPDCATCGACCREAFDLVPIEVDDRAFPAAFPELVHVADDGYVSIQRVPSPFPDLGSGTRCACLSGDGKAPTPFRCTRYAQRPVACSELEAGSESCRFARRRVGLED